MLDQKTQNKKKLFWGDFKRQIKELTWVLLKKETESLIKYPKIAVY